MALSLREARTPEEREQVFRIRYQVYVKEMHVRQRFADHEREIVREPLDDHAHLFAAFAADGSIVGTLRINLGREGDLGEYVPLHRLPEFAPYSPRQVSVTTKLMFLPQYRNTREALRLMCTGFRFLLDNDVAFDFGDCRPGNERFFMRVGYRQVFPSMQHLEDGPHVPLVLVLRDRHHLAACRSPFAAYLPGSACEEGSVSFFHSKFALAGPAALA